MWQTVLIQLFWLSFTLIGLGALLAWGRLYKNPETQRPIYKYLSNCHPIQLVFIVTALGLALMALVLAPSYLFNLSIRISCGAYLILLAASIALIIFERQSWRQWLIRLKKGLQFKRKKWLLLVIGMVVFNYGLWLHVGGSLQLDTPVQLSRLTTLINGHTSFKDPYFGNNGVSDVRYSINLITSLMGVGATLLGVTALKMWLYSYAWLGLLTMLAVFSLAWELFTKQARRFFAYGAAILAPFLFIGYFFNSVMPTQEALIWTILLIIGLKVLYTTKNGLILFLAAVLIAATQPINCVMAIGFLVILAVCLALAKLLTKTYTLSLLGAMAIMSLAIILELHYPDRIKLDQAAFNADAGTLGSITPHKYGPFLISQIKLGFSAWQVILYACAVAIAFLVRPFKNRRWLFIFLLAAGLGLEIWAYNVLLLTVMGFLYLVYVTKDLPTRITVLAIGLYYSLLAYNPLIINFNQGRLPWWFFARFEYFNILVFITLPLGIIMLHVAPGIKWRFTKGAWTLYAILAAILFIPIIRANPDYGAYVSFDGITSVSVSNNYQKPYINTINNIYALRSELKGKMIMSDNGDLTLRIPQAVTANVLSFEHDQNAAPMSNLPLRKACNAQLVSYLSTADLKAAGINTIATLSDNPAFVRLLKSKPYIKFETKYHGISLYSLDPGTWNVPAGLVSKSVCNIPYGQ